MKYRPRIDVVEDAVQWDGSKEAEEKISKMLGLSDGQRATRIRRGGGPDWDYALAILGDNVNSGGLWIDRGCWLVKLQDRGVRVMTHYEFTEKYEPVPGKEVPE